MITINYNLSNQPAALPYSFPGMIVSFAFSDFALLCAMVNGVDDRSVRNRTFIWTFERGQNDEARTAFLRADRMDGVLDHGLNRR